MNHAHSYRFAMLSLAILCACSSLAQAQPGGPPPPPGPRGGDAAAVLDPAMVRERLQRRLEDIRRFESRLEGLLARLDAGESPADVLRDLAPLDGMREGGRRGPREPRSPERPEARPGDRGGDFPPVPGRPEGRGERDGPRERQGPPDQLASIPDDRPLTPEERERVMAFLRETMPSMAERFLSLTASDPEAADRMLSRMLPRLREASRLREEDPELFTLKGDELRTGVEVIGAARALRASQNAPAGTERDAAIASARAALREAVTRQIDARLRVQEHELAVLMRRVESLQADLLRRQAGRDAAIAETLERVERGPGARDGRREAPRGAPGERPPADEPR